MNFEIPESSTLILYLSTCALWMTKKTHFTQQKHMSTDMILEIYRFLVHEKKLEVIIKKKCPKKPTDRGCNNAFKKQISHL